jgi:folate-binding Fe-S cluster repair protein YgfZ
MQHRGTARKRILPVSTMAAVLPAPGTPVTTGDATIGTMGSSAGSRGLALLRVDRVLEAQTAGANVFAGDAAIDVDVPAWAVPKGPVP